MLGLTCEGVGAVIWSVVGFRGGVLPRDAGALALAEFVSGVVDWRRRPQFFSHYTPVHRRRSLSDVPQIELIVANLTMNYPR